MKHNEAIGRLLAIADSHPELAENMQAAVGHIASTMLVAEHAAIILREAVDYLPDQLGLQRSYDSIEEQLVMLGAPERISRASRQEGEA